MLKRCRVTKVKVFFLVLVYVFNFDLFEFSAAILEKGLLQIFQDVFFLFSGYFYAPIVRTQTFRSGSTHRTSHKWN